MRSPIFPDTAGQELNKHWKASQPKPVKDAPPAIPEAVKHVRISSHRREIPVDQIFPYSGEPDKKFCHIYHMQIKSGTAKAIDVEQIAPDKYVLVDGIRRVTAARALGMKTILAVVQGGFPETHPAPVPQKQEDCEGCSVRAACRRLMNSQNRAPDIARGWCGLIDASAREMRCLTSLGRAGT